ncbi:type II toxin-antitoxin system VapC family toxin [Phaeodactylibacter xiamenensis]|jgi:predicted nucleic acid-binding protein|uniref:type II toxin-antitoxin system VapC family toxin n=1 Tax=Phaeodactylibacter xiamenensis TaxID=1524460 RepID=UPI003CCB8021
MMVLCDTNIFIHAFNGNTVTIDELNKIGLSNIILSAVTVMELYQGMGNKAELDQMKKRINFYDKLQIDKATSIMASGFIEDYRLSHGLLIPDAIIGATAIVHNIPLYTYNIKDFGFLPGIKLYQES